jgi:hypothetical protein
MVCFGLLPNCAFAVLDKPTFGVGTSPIFTVDQHPVDKAEFVFFMYQERALVIQRIMEENHGKSSSNFWDECTSEGKTPRALLRDQTVKRVIREKEQQILFKELGLVNDIRFASFTSNLAKMNLEREAKARNGGVVFGPVHFSELQYYPHWMTTTSIAAKEKLSMEKWDMCDENVKKFLATVTEATAGQSTDSTIKTNKSVTAHEKFLYSEHLYNELIDDRVRKASVEMDTNRLDLLVK